MRICFRIPKDEVTIDGSRRYCIYIPILLPPWWKKFRNPGGPVELFTDGWMTSNQLNATQARDLSVLATMHELASQLSPAIQRSLEGSMNQAFKTIELPKSVTLSFDEQVQKE